MKKHDNENDEELPGNEVIDGCRWKIFKRNSFSPPGHICLICWGELRVMLAIEDEKDETLETASD